MVINEIKHLHLIQEKDNFLNYQKLEIHEAAHAVIAVHLGMSFGRIVMKSSISKKTGKLMPPGITNLEGGPEEMRLAALAGCVAADCFERVSPDLIWARSRFNKTLEEALSERVVRCLESNGLDKGTYDMNGNPLDDGQFSEDISKVEKLVEENWINIERVATQLGQLPDPKIMSREEVVRLLDVACL